MVINRSLWRESLPPGGTPQGGFSCPFGQFTSRCPSAHTGADEGGACRNLCVFMKTRTLRPHFPHQSRLRRASFPQGKPFTNPNLQPLRNHLVGRGLAPADSRCGCSRRGHKPLRLRANPARPLAVPGLCPSAPGLMPLLATPPRYKFTLRHARGRVAKPCDCAEKHPGLRPSLVCRHPLRS